MAAIEPNPAQRTTLIEAAVNSQEPVVMINLLQFAPDGAASYQRYAKEVQPYLDAVDATVVYAGDTSHVVAGEIDRPWWDAIVVVRYPENAHVYRAAALDSTHLIATEPWLLSQ